MRASGADGIGLTFYLKMEVQKIISWQDVVTGMQNIKEYFDSFLFCYLKKRRARSVSGRHDDAKQRRPAVDSRYGPASNG